MLVSRKTRSMAQLITRRQRVQIICSRLAKAPPCGTKDEADHLIRQIFKSVERTAAAWNYGKVSHIDNDKEKEPMVCDDLRLAAQYYIFGVYYIRHTVLVSCTGAIAIYYREDDEKMFSVRSYYGQKPQFEKPDKFGTDVFGRIMIFQ
jgi:hypothetical protein